MRFPILSPPSCTKLGDFRGATLDHRHNEARPVDFLLLGQLIDATGHDESQSVARSLIHELEKVVLKVGALPRLKRYLRVEVDAVTSRLWMLTQRFHTVIRAAELAEPAIITRPQRRVEARHVV